MSDEQKEKEAALKRLSQHNGILSINADNHGFILWQFIVYHMNQIKCYLPICVRPEDSVYNELNAILDAMGQTKQTFYETYTKTVISERCIPFIIKAPSNDSSLKQKKLSAFEKLENLKKNHPIDIDFNQEREEAANEKYGVID